MTILPVPHNNWIARLLQGVLIGLIGTVIVGLITFKLQVRLPYKKMLVVPHQQPNSSKRQSGFIVSRYG